MVRREHTDVVIAEFNPRILSNLLAFVKAKMSGVRFIWWGHGIRPNSGPVDKRVYLWLARRADAAIFYTEAGAKGLIELGLAPEKTFIAWNSIETDEIDGLAQDASFSQRHRILYIGRLIADKKPELLVRGFALARPHLRPGTVLTLIGSGPERERLEALARELGIAAHVEFTGGMYEQAKLAPYFNDSWVSVSPGYIGLSAIHSLAYGVPMLVADDEPHSPEIVAIDDANSRYFRAGDAEDLAAKLLELARDPERTQEMGAAGRRSVKERFSVGAMVQAFEAAIAYATRGTKSRQMHAPLTSRGTNV